MGIQSFATFLDSHLRGNDTKEQNVNLFKTFTIATQCSRISNKKSLPLDGGGQVGVHPVRYYVVVNSVTLKKLVSFIVSPVRCLLSNGVKDKNNHPPLTPPIVRLSVRLSSRRRLTTKSREGNVCNSCSCRNLNSNKCSFHIFT